MYRIRAPKARYQETDQIAGGHHTRQSRTQGFCETQVVTPRVVRLRERRDNSNHLLLRIPIDSRVSERGRQGICMDPGRLPHLLGLSDQNITRLRQAGLLRIQPQKP
jgi:hypothetical protein